MQTKQILFLSLLFITLQSQAQQAYFQQKVDYTIQVSLDDEAHSLSGDLVMDYTNNSPDELPFLWMHLWPNAYAGNNTALGQERLKEYPFTTILETDSTRGYIDSLDFSVGGVKLKWEFHPEHTDICKVWLSQPLKPGASIRLHTPFRVKIPSGYISRLGHIKQTYAITQWYPKPAVYDRYGWHEMPYVDQGEFFSEFGSFNVYITVPQNYRVAATGELKNEAEKIWLDSLALLVPDSVNRDTVLPSATTTKTLHFSENKVHDFAWFAAKNYHVCKDQVNLPNGREVQTWTFYTDQSKESWRNATQYINDALFYYSKWNGSYPYKNCTAVEGPLMAGGGMEYPGITIIGSYADTIELDEVIMHEVGHNWFYGFLGSNERRYPYLDEGINSANEQRYMELKYPELKLSHMMGSSKLSHFLGVDEVPYEQMKEYSYLLNAKRNYAQAAMLNAREYTSMNYGAIIYWHSANIFNHLRQYLGNAVYDSVFHAYYRQHLFQHVYPNDLEAVFKAATDKELDWFFHDWLQTTKNEDYALRKTKGSQVLVKNSGAVNSPFLLQALQDTAVVAEKWVDGFEGKQWIDLQTNNFDRIYIDKENHTCDFNRHNNYIRSTGLMKKTEPLQFKLLSGLDFTDKTEVYYLPFVTYTVPGGFMPGLVLHNKTFYQKRVEYMLTPMYSYQADLLAGSASINFFFPLQDGFLRNIYLHTKALQYAGWGTNAIQKAGGELKLEFRDPVNNVHEYFAYAKANYATRMEDVVQDSTNAEFNTYLNFGLKYKNISKRYPMEVIADVEASSAFTKLSLNGDFTLGMAARRNLYVHWNTRTFLGQGPDQSYYQHQLMGTNGVTDYKYDYIFFDRFGGAAMQDGRQFIGDGGGFSVASPGAFSNTWMQTVNVSYSLHVLVRPYVNGAVYQSLAGETLMACEAGLRLGMKDVLEVYFPFYYINAGNANAAKDDYNIYDNYATNIRVMLNFNQLNPAKLREKILY